ncbi:MAG TPA: hypothetical protein VK439_03040, partial [Rubrivivax sp.]|nr:hypothetical protein [Rubrivivax sp.]
MRPKGGPELRRMGASWAPAAAVTVAVLALAALSVRNDFVAHRQQAAARVQGLADLRVTQLQSWIAGQLALAGLAVRSVEHGQHFQRWQVAGDAAAGDELMARMVELRQAVDADSVLLLAADGRVLAKEHATSETQ